MKLKKGYKQTEVGVIPGDWEVKELGRIGKFSKGQGIKKDDSQSGDIPCVRYGELYTRHSDYVKRYYSFISDSVAQTSKKLRKGDILFAGSGETKAEIGKCAAFVDDIDAYVGGDVVLLSPIDCNSLFLGYLLNAPFITKQKASKGQGDAVVHISAGQLKSVQIPLPPTREEQTAIATALSDADALISRLETLIAKKRAIKQGAMQQLLKPKEGWVAKRLGELCSPSKNRINPIISTESYKCVELEHLSQESGRLLGFADSIGLKSQKTIFEKGDVLFGKLRPYLRKYLFAEFNGVCTTEIWVLSPMKGVESKWLYYLVQSDRIIEAANLSTGTKMPRAEWKIVSDTLVYLPRPNEQTRIAQILSDMDAEIAGLEQKLAKYKLVKQGMMQELLTGKTRLV